MCACRRYALLAVEQSRCIAVAWLSELNDRKGEYGAVADLNTSEANDAPVDEVPGGPLRRHAITVARERAFELRRDDVIGDDAYRVAAGRIDIQCPLRSNFPASVSSSLIASSSALYAWLRPRRISRFEGGHGPATPMTRLRQPAPAVRRWRRSAVT